MPALAHLIHFVMCTHRFQQKDLLLERDDAANTYGPLLRTLDYGPVPNSPHDFLHEFARRYNRARPRLIFPLRLPDLPLQHVAPLLNQALGEDFNQRFLLREGQTVG